MPIVFSYHDGTDEKLAAQFKDLSASDGRSLGFKPMRVTHDGSLAHVESAGKPFQLTQRVAAMGEPQAPHAIYAPDTHRTHTVTAFRRFFS
jgi:hypothetical protein